MDDRILIAVDVDGTLINTEYDDVVRRREIAAIRGVRAAGHVLALCTGRNLRSAAYVVRGAGGSLDDAPQILLNGALVIEAPGGRVLRAAGLPRETLAELVALFKEHGALPMVFGLDHEGGTIWREEAEPNAVLLRYLERRLATVGAVEIVSDLIAALPERAQEVGTIDRTETSLALGEAVRERFGDAVWVISTESLLERETYRWVEVVPSFCHKGTGLELLASELEIPRERIVAIGDNYNDLDMFGAAGFTVAMGNAPDDVKDAADRVAPHVAHHGAASVLEEIARGEWPPRAD